MRVRLSSTASAANEPATAVERAAGPFASPLATLTSWAQASTSPTETTRVVARPAARPSSQAVAAPTITPGMTNRTSANGVTAPM